MVSNHNLSRVNPGSFASNPPMSGCQACGSDLDRLLREDDALTQAWAGLPQRRFEAGQLIAQPGDEAHAIWRVETGLIRAYYLSQDGVERNRSFHLERQWLGAVSPSPLRPTIIPYAIEALEATVLTELPYSVIQTWSERKDIHGRLIDALATSLARREVREEGLLLKDASQRYLEFMAQEPVLADRVPLHHVASYLGITNVALSRIRRRLRDQGTELG